MAVSSGTVSSTLLAPCTGSSWQGPLPPRTHTCGKAKWPEDVLSSGASGMWTSDKSGSPWGKPGSSCGGRLGPRPRAGLHRPADPRGSGSRPGACPFSCLPLGQTPPGLGGSGEVAGVQPTDPACLVACSFGEVVPRAFTACWAEVSWSRAGSVGEPGTRSAGNSRRLAASSSVTKTGVIRTFGGSAAPASCGAAPAAGSVWS